MLGPFDLVVPPLILIGAIATLPFTLLILPLTNRTQHLFSWAKFRHAWFDHFWTWFGLLSKPFFTSSVRPLLSQAGGIVIELGPGNGVWMDELARNGKITKVWGVEPNENFRKTLLRRAKAVGLEGVYEPVTTMEEMGLEEGSVDTTVTVHVLCSVGDQAERIVRDLYRYLKPGGKWLVYEHVGSTYGPIQLWQDLHNRAWTGLLDGCDLTKDTGEMLGVAAGWSSFDVKRNKDDGYFDSLPHVVGVMRK